MLSIKKVQQKQNNKNRRRGINEMEITDQNTLKHAINSITQDDNEMMKGGICTRRTSH